MDHLSFIFSLLFIFSVTITTFGSPNKAGNPNGEELENILKRSHSTEAKLEGPKHLEDQDNDAAEIAGVIIQGIELTMKVLDRILSGIANVNRKCAIGVDNESGYHWEQGSTYLYSGKADENLPYDVPDGYAALFGPRKTSGAARGSVGVIAYYISDIHLTISVMFHVPYDYNLYDNWWNVKLYDGNQRASEDQFDDLYYYADPIRANGWHERSLGYGLKFRGSMSNSGTATLEIHVLSE